MVSWSKGGSSSPKNLATACDKCNRYKAAQIAFPPQFCEGIGDDGWSVHRSFGDWKLKFTTEDLVMEYPRTGYRIGIARAHDPHQVVGSDAFKVNFSDAISYFRELIRPDVVTGRPHRHQNALQFACSWLYQALLNGPQHASFLQSASVADGIADRTLKRAKSELNVVSRRQAGKWMWARPTDPAPLTEEGCTDARDSGEE